MLDHMLHFALHKAAEKGFELIKESLSGNNSSSNNSPAYTAPAMNSNYNPQIRQRLVDIIVGRLAVTPDQVTDDASFVQDLGADSLDTADLLMIIENEFGVKIPDEVTENIQTVGDALNYIQHASGA